MRYTYPAVIYKVKEEDAHVLVVPDCNIVVDGDTIDEIVKEASEQLKVFLHCVSKFGATVVSPTPMEDFNLKYKGEMIMQVACDLSGEDDDNITFLF